MISDNLSKDLLDYLSVRSFSDQGGIPSTIATGPDALLHFLDQTGTVSLFKNLEGCIFSAHNVHPDISAKWEKYKDLNWSSVHIVRKIGIRAGMTDYYLLPLGSKNWAIRSYTGVVRFLENNPDLIRTARAI